MIPTLVVLNAGSSSLKFQVFDMVDRADPELVWRGQYEGLGRAARFRVTQKSGALLDQAEWAAERGIDHEGALMHLVAWLQQYRNERSLVAIGHRVVHGGDAFAAPVLVSDEVVAKLAKLAPLAPLHQPHNLKPMEVAHRRLPTLPQVACFDTAFHHSQSEIATMFALPRTMRDRGVRRYGFHGLSYDYIASVLKDHDPRLAAGKVIVAHLGNGASLCALSGGTSVATTMGFSALDGLPMGTRCGAIDASIVFYMLREMGCTADEAERILYTQSGLLGVSSLSNDMRTLRTHAPSNTEARKAIDLFVYRILRETGSLIAALGGLDGLVFTAGIGENDAATRAAVVAGLTWAGLELDEAANSTGGPKISSSSSASAWVIPTNEELVIARQTRDVISAATLPH
ncbi:MULTISPECIES: acetate/propionate family kinase [unclassified Chelatococcus]|uniref:acetate/propionate family kinase n=1 Tax=unclassified Chelatococcus TaxID=2638111 RepID=UPI001BCEAE00|nr:MULTISPECIES: acetate/propionate family kinase [unclassified Chelatococcus]CAH1652562.1 Acetate kinase [Hyphomicrobiales bacterium]MBS7743016.1 acetate/propionate family kinase [Chelatococcus sp. HY11]MBX3541866.1 acetate/propionate family kinase [Chelatococcus sp.]MCO5074243.1 acetate/propionate family kinase [Chelatococcus sp.]CAH1693922.1 Acetate kinase [Hyphomicrobiales bacterium]